MFFRSVTIDLTIKLKSFVVTVSVKALNNILNSVFYINIGVGVTVIGINKGFFLRQSSFIWIYR